MNFSVHIDEETLARVQAAVARVGMTRNRLIVTAVQEWLTRNEARAVLAGTHPAIKAPPRVAIARTLLQAWVDGFEV